VDFLFVRGCGLLLFVCNIQPFGKDAILPSSFELFAHVLVYNKTSYHPMLQLVTLPALLLRLSLFNVNHATFKHLDGTAGMFTASLSVRTFISV